MPLWSIQSQICVGSKSNSPPAFWAGGGTGKILLDGQMYQPVTLSGLALQKNPYPTKHQSTRRQGRTSGGSSLRLHCVHEGNPFTPRTPISMNHRVEQSEHHPSGKRQQGVIINTTLLLAAVGHSNCAPLQLSFVWFPPHRYCHKQVWCRTGAGHRAQQIHRHRMPLNFFCPNLQSSMLGIEGENDFIVPVLKVHMSTQIRKKRENPRGIKTQLVRKADSCGGMVEVGEEK